MLASAPCTFRWITSPHILGLPPPRQPCRRLQLLMSQHPANTGATPICSTTTRVSRLELSRILTTRFTPRILRRTALTPHPRAHQPKRRSPEHVNNASKRCARLPSGTEEPQE